LKNLGEAPSRVSCCGKTYVLHFPKDQILDANFFWSVAMCTLPERLLVENPINMGLEAGYRD
jgi:hypothetical protein